jgi:hypothetical protein
VPLTIYHAIISRYRWPANGMSFFCSTAAVPENFMVFVPLPLKWRSITRGVALSGKTLAEAGNRLLQII